MAERRPAGFNVDLGFSDSKEVMSIPARYRAAAVGVWTLCGSWAAFKMTDGHVPPDVLKAKGCTVKIRECLIASTLWTPAEDGGIWFTNWSRWQRTRAEISAYRKAERERKRQSRSGRADDARTPHDNQEARGARAALAAAIGVEPPMTGEDEEMSGWTPNGYANSVRPEPGNLSPKPSIELSRELSAVGDAAGPPPFPDHCAEHANDPSPPACPACGRVRQQNRDAAQRADADAAAAARAAAERRRNCTRCDGYGFVPVDPTDDDPWAPTMRCPECTP